MGSDYNATLVDRTVLAPGLISIKVRPDTAPPPFKAGQYVTLGLRAKEARVAEAGPVADETGPPRVAAGRGSRSGTEHRADLDRLIRRAYCMVSDSSDHEAMEFYLTLILSGELTPRLFNLKVGDRLHVGDNPRGVFTLDRAAGKHILMVATGTGLAPYMSMMRAELEMRPGGRPGRRQLWQCNGPRHFVIVHGARHSWDLGYRSELTGLSRHCANLHYMPLIIRPDEDPTWRGASGNLQDFLPSGAIEREVGLAVEPGNFDLFLSGHPDMIDELTGWAETRGFRRDVGHQVGTLHAEHYW